MLKEDTQKEILLRGVVRRITFQAPDSGYVVCRVLREGALEETTLTGTNLHLSSGLSIIARGRFVHHPKFGEQFLASAVEHIIPSTEEGLKRYLGSGLFSGIGEKTAERIIKHFGTDALTILRNAPERLREVSGIGRKKAALFAQELLSHEERREIDRFFLEYGIQPTLIDKIYRKFGVRSIEIIKQNPYILAYKIHGIGFITADAIALKLGLSRSAPQRLESGLVYALEKAKNDGHCFLRYAELAEKATRLLELEQDKIDFHPYLERLHQAKQIQIDGDDIYLTPLYNAENVVADFIASRVTKFKTPQIPLIKQKEAIQEAEEALNITLSAKQRQAVHFAADYPLLAISGGPGCGKTTLIKALSIMFKKAEKVLALAAPTGKAAQRMSQVCGVPAYTIHRLLGYDPIKNTFNYRQNEPLCIDNGSETPQLVDAVIIDEASMIDIQLAKALFCAIPQRATLILVGDKDQLPSVGPGRLFADILSLDSICTVTLTQLYRREEASKITTIAHEINSGRLPQIPAIGSTISDAYFVELNDTTEIVNYVLRLITKQIPKYRNLTSKDISVLTPANVGPLGTLELNYRLQDALNPTQIPGKFINIGNKQLRVGDKVCQRVNNYKIDLDGVFNGDSGTVREVDAANESIVVELWDGRFIKYQGKAIEQLSLAYAVTIHRSQGSELPCVIMVLHDSHYILLERQLIYTGITRAKELLFIIGTRRALYNAVTKTSVNQRQTNLCRRITNSLQIINTTIF
ncbi:MAG: ATP-dependent RecD-like DNA helicase [Bdellovibrionota bacterium]